MNLVVVEDSSLILEQLLRLLASEPRLNVLGTAGDEKQAVALINRTQPDAILLDLALAPGSGVRVLEQIRQAGSGARVLVLSNNTGGPLRDVCRELGASGFYDKSREVQACLDHLRSWLPPMPAQEPQRLAEVQGLGLLDQPEQEVFDDITQLACSVLDVPMALVSLVDEHRQWFLSHTGLAVRQTSRSVAFCAHAIVGEGLMEVPDALQDPRFHDNPLVQGPPHLRFYAGVPLVMPSGEAVGTLCLLDTQPRQLDEAQRKTLRILARHVVGELELRQRVEQLQQFIQQRDESEARLRLMSTQDALTGLVNRATFLDRVAMQTRMSGRRGESFAVMFLDLDQFKWINDTLGHDVGDTTLGLVAERLAKALRQSDTVARLGGDEFAILMPELSHAQEALTLGEKLIQAVSRPFELRGRQLHVGASLGIALYPQHGQQAEDLLRYADLALHQGKRLGGGCVTLFEKTLDEQAGAQMALENDLQQAIDNDDLVVWFQPQICLDASQRLCSVEALVRWQHPRLGLLAPDRFIRLAEQRGQIGAIGAKVLDASLARLAHWDRLGLEVPRVAVNVSALELRKGYMEQVSQALRRHGLAPQRLELEITETAFFEDGQEVLRVLDSLRALGVSIAVDDFGVGYSSLGNLRRLPIDTLKIDRSFIREVDRTDKDEAIMRAVVTMARVLGLRTVAEGVETESQRARTLAMGCDCVQGYLLSKPMPAIEFETWARTVLPSTRP